MMPMKKVCRVFDIQKNNLIENDFTGVPDRDMRACFNQSTRRPAMNMQQPPLRIGTNNVSRSSDEEKAQWESMMICLFTTLWQKLKSAVLTFCTIPVSTRTLSPIGIWQNERLIRWNNKSGKSQCCTNDLDGLRK